jgi:hypothetical protein
MLRLRTVTTARVPVGCVALALALAWASLAPVATPLHATSLRLSLNLNLATSRELSTMATGALVAEVNAIWHASLSLVWRTADVSEPLPAMPESEDWLRVLVLARQTPGAQETSTFTVGELVRTEGARPLAIASITAARRIVDEAARHEAWDGPGDYDRRIGVVLGRAVAHEIGHYQLRTRTHADRGLMRATIDALEFADTRSRAFVLDNLAQAYLAELASTPSSQLPVFSYASR